MCAARVDIWIDPFADPDRSGLTRPCGRSTRSARGGLFGEGLGQGLLPTPSIPSSGRHRLHLRGVAEELGLIGAFALLALFLALVFRGLRVAMLARDDFSAMLAVGLTASLGLQTLIIAAGNVKLSRSPASPSRS